MEQPMTSNVRKFGVDDPDQYWRERVANSRASEKRIHRFIFEQIQSLFPPGAAVLDCGVGDGHVFRLCREHYQTYGVEFSQEAIDRYEFPTNTISRFDLNGGIPFDKQFDAIVISMVLHWLDQPQQFLQNAARHLSPRGRLLVVIPNVTNYHYRIGFLFGKFPPISPSHKNIQTPAEAESMFRAAGYHIEKRLSPKPGLRAKLWPTLFSADILYILSPGSLSRSRGTATP